MKLPVSIDVNDISWTEPRNKQKILNPVSFNLDPGKILGVVGPNGAGKSTLLRLLYRYQKPSTGVIKIDGKDIWSMSAKKVACIIAAVLQEQITDFALTVREIVTLGWYIAARTIMASEDMPIGIVTGLVGGVFLYGYLEENYRYFCWLIISILYLLSIIL